MTASLRFRSHEAELMDDPDVDPRVLREALRQLALINSVLGGTSTSLAGLRRLIPASTPSFSFLDVGCGSGDTLLAVAQCARRRGQTVRLHGIELSEVSAEMARERLSKAGIKILPPRSRAETPLRTTAQIDVLNLFDLEPPPHYDVVHAALVLHHISDDGEAVRALARMASLARTGIILNDLHRHSLAHGSIRLLTRLLSRNPLIRNDAALSVRRSFTREELLAMGREAGLRDMSLHWRWAFRWLLVARTSFTHTSREE